MVRCTQLLGLVTIFVAAVLFAACGGTSRSGDGHRTATGPSRATGAGKPRPNPPLPAVVEIKSSGPDWEALLVKALGTPNTTVRLAPSVDIDLSGSQSIAIAHGVTVTSDQPCATIQQSKAATLAGGKPAVRPPVVGPPTCSARNPQHLGPRLYTTTRPQPLLSITCDKGQAGNVRLSGFRLQGPQLDVTDGDDNLEFGIEIDSCVGVEIANMELSGWSGAAIGVDDNNGNIQIPVPPDYNPAGISIHDNFIHHDQHVGKFGYGVALGAGGYATIERNVFDYNRHAITASGQAGIGYRASQNLVLRGGGVHGKFYEEYIQEFDVHGDDNCFPPGGRHTWNCGNAGEQFSFTYNAFQYTRANAIKLRGTPRRRSLIEHNVFAHESVGDAVELFSSKNVQLGVNTAGFDSYGKYGVCDFDGDGKDDLFLPTGVTWWYSSGGKMNWWYLNAASELLGQVALGDFDGDGLCDVLAVHGDDWVVSSRGTSPWKSLGTYHVPLDQLAFGRFLGDGKTDVFRRSPTGQWYVISPGSQDWHAVASSSFPLNQLHFGDFTGDGITDVLATQGGHWSISRSAAGAWETLNPNLSGGLDGVLIADVNGNGIDDIVRFKPLTETSGRLEVSWEGRSDWQTFRTVTWESTSPKVPELRLFAGRFDDAPGADILFLDSSRLGRRYSNASATPTVQNLYAY